MTPLRQRMLDALELRGMAGRTQKAYIDAVARLARHYRRSPDSLYNYSLATYDDADSFRHADSEGFVRLWGLGIETWMRLFIWLAIGLVIYFGWGRRNSKLANEP